MENEINKMLLLTLCPEYETLLISKEVLDALENPGHIQLLINLERKKLLLQSCEMTERDVVVVPEDTADSFTMSCPMFLKKLWQKMGWCDNCSRVLCGNKMKNRPAILFDLNEAHPAELRSPLDASSD